MTSNADPRSLQRRRDKANATAATLVVQGHDRDINPTHDPRALEKRRNKANATAANMVVRGKKAVTTETETITAIQPVALSLVDLAFVLSLVFGGCCSNVWAYEYLLKIDTRMGTALTFSQMLFVTLTSLPSFLTWNWKLFFIPIPILKTRQVPLTKWVLQVLVHTSGSLLNNWAFAFHVPLTLQIVFRSAGLAVSMLFGKLFMNKRYTSSQIVCMVLASVFLVSVGVVLATLSRPSASSKDYTKEDFAEYTIGVLMLTISLLLTGVLGVLQEKTYTQYGSCWREGVFYTHFLSLPVFLFLVPHVKHGFHSLASSTYRPTPTAHSLTQSITLLDYASSYRSYLILAANLTTQLVCVSGVNQLTSRVSSVSTNLVLTTRKAISLCFSVWWFGNGWNTELGIGAGMVFTGSLLYALVSSGSGSGSRDKRSSKKTQ